MRALQRTMGGIAQGMLTLFDVSHEVTLYLTVCVLLVMHNGKFSLSHVVQANFIIVALIVLLS